MYKILICLAMLLGIVHSGNADVMSINEMSKITPDSTSGFAWPYYLYTPTRSSESPDTITILVQPTNTGQCTDDYSVQDHDTRHDINNLRDLCDNLSVVALMPVFPRPKTDWQIYTHALDRDAILTDLPGLKRLDLQLVAMIQDARRQLEKKSMAVHEKVLLMGFSASGMFVNRFAVLHPGLVKAVACGSPGGWPIAPLFEWKGESLRYPVGIADVSEIAGIDFDSAAFADIPIFLYLGDQDTNDAVAFDDGYDLEDRELVNRLFGTTPVSRWPIIEKIYRQVNPRCRLKLYENVGHEINREMWKDIRIFLREYR